MSDQIQKGDVVYVAKNKSCCGSNSQVGYIFTATDFTFGKGKCMQCGAIHEHRAAADESGKLWFEVSRLKKIPPLTELELVDENSLMVSLMRTGRVSKNYTREAIKITK